MKSAPSLIILALLMCPSLFFAKPAHAYADCSKYGYLAVYDILTNSCKCMSGYGFKDDIFGNSTCVSLDTLCRDELGYNARYNSLKNTCECRYGYVISGGECTDGNVVCHLKYGYNSSYNSLNSSCECDSGYTFDDYNQCVKKQNNVYFHVKELDTDNRTAIIKSDYDYSYYLIEYGIGCLSSTFQRYINKQIVVNLGTDFSLDVWDKIVLQDDDQNCNITHKELVDSSTTLEHDSDTQSLSPNYGNDAVLIDAYCKSKFGNGAIGVGTSCYCGIGYELNSDKSGCILKNASCPINSTYISGQCVCNMGSVYNPLTASCVDYNTSCRLSYGQNSFGDASYCYCNEGYQFNPEKTACILKQTSAQPSIPPASIVETSSNPNQNTEEWISQQIAKQTATNTTLVSRLSGRILLQTESHGEAWYLNPIIKKRFYLKDGATAYQMLRSFGLGISESDYERIMGGDTKLKSNLKGRIILRVQAHGEAYYINPKDLRPTYLKDGDAAYQAMRNLSLGISDSDISTIPIERFVPVK